LAHPFDNKTAALIVLASSKIKMTTIATPGTTKWGRFRMILPMADAEVIRRRIYRIHREITAALRQYVAAY
jgi:hypothetical protein